MTSVRADLESRTREVIPAAMIEGRGDHTDALIVSGALVCRALTNMKVGRTFGEGPLC